MTTNSITERIRQNRLFVDDWSVFEKLLLASAVLKSGDQNWGSVSKMILNLLKCGKFVEKKRPSDWFTPKACNTQYQLLIETYANDLPRRKKRDRNSSESSTETPVEFIVKQLWLLRMDEIDQFSRLKRKSATELERLIRDAAHGRLSQQEIESHYEALEAKLSQQEVAASLEYEEMMRSREEKRKLIEAKTSVVFPGSVNSTSLIHSSTADEKSSSSPTSPLLTSLLQSPSRSTTPIMSNLLISKLLESPSPPSTSQQPVQTTALPASSLLQKELSRPVPQSSSTPQLPLTPALVPLPSPSPNSIAALEELKVDDLAAVVDKAGEDVEEFDEKWFDPSVLNMGKEELAKALFEGLGIITGRNESVESDVAVPEEVLPLDLEEPATVEEEVVLEEHIIQSVEEAMDVARSTTHIKLESPVIPSDQAKPPESSEVKPEVEGALDTPKTEVKPEDKEVMRVTDEATVEEKVKPTCVSDATDSSVTSTTTSTATLASGVSDPPSSVPSEVPPPPPLKPKTLKLPTVESIRDTRKSTTTSSETTAPSSQPPPLVAKETRSQRASRESDRSTESRRDLAAESGVAADSKSPRRVDSLAEPRERRRSRLGEDPSPVRDRRGQQESTGAAVSPTLPPPASPAKETRSSRLSTMREESQNSPGKELRSVKVSQGGKELRTRGGSSSRGESEAGSSPSLGGKELRTRGGSSGRGESEASPSPVPRSPRNSKDVESSPVKETRSKSREEPPASGPGKLNKESPAKEVKPGRVTENTRKSLLDSPSSNKKSLETTKRSASETASRVHQDAANKSLDSPKKFSDTPTRSPANASNKSLDSLSKSLDTSASELRRRLRSEPDFTGHLHESEDSSEDESSPELLEEMTLDWTNDPLMSSNVSSLPTDVQDEFKAPLTAGGRKRKTGDGRGSPFLSDKEGKPVQDPRAKKTLLAVYQTILTYKHASVFMKPVSDTQAKDYSSIVRVQANLSGIKKRIESGAIRTVCQFQRSVLLVFTNAMMYNNVDDTLYKLAKETMLECNKDLQILVKAVADSGGVEYNLAPRVNDASVTAGGTDTPIQYFGSDRIKRTSSASPLPVPTRKKKRVGGEEEEEKEEGGGRRGTKRSAAPSPQPTQGKKRKTK